MVQEGELGMSTSKSCTKHCSDGGKPVANGPRTKRGSWSEELEDPHCRGESSIPITSSTPCPLLQPVMLQPKGSNPFLKPTQIVIGVADGEGSQIAWRQLQLLGTEDLHEGLTWRNRRAEPPLQSYEVEDTEDGGDGEGCIDDGLCTYVEPSYPQCQAGEFRSQRKGRRYRLF